jgi:hypothetical protein
VGAHVADTLQAVAHGGMPWALVLGKWAIARAALVPVATAFAAVVAAWWTAVAAGWAMDAARDRVLPASLAPYTSLLYSSALPAAAGGGGLVSFNGAVLLVVVSCATVAAKVALPWLPIPALPWMPCVTRRPPRSVAPWLSHHVDCGGAWQTVRFSNFGWFVAGAVHVHPARVLVRVVHWVAGACAVAWLLLVVPTTTACLVLPPLPERTQSWWQLALDWWGRDVLVVIGAVSLFLPLLWAWWQVHGAAARTVQVRHRRARLGFDGSILIDAGQGLASGIAAVHRYAAGLGGRGVGVIVTVLVCMCAVGCATLTGLQVS